MKDYTNRVTVARVHLADAVIQLHLVVAPHSFHRANVDGEDGRVSLPKRQHHGAGLHPRTLRGHHEPSPLEILARLIQQNAISVGNTCSPLVLTAPMRS